MNRLYVVGGRQRYNRSQLEAGCWHTYHAGVILRVDPDSREITRCVEYVSPPEARAADDPEILFKSGTLEGDTLYVTTKTEVVIYRVPDFEQVGYISLPCF